MSEITKELVERYEQVRASGKFNMVMDMSSAMLAMKLNPRHKSDMHLYFDIVQNYSMLMKKFGIERMN